MAIDFNAPSQVRPYANLGAFPATGAVKTIYIAEDTNYIYRWNGTAYIEISVADLVGYVPYSGATEDLNLGNYDAYVNKLWLYDSVNDNYGSVHFTDTDFHIEDADGHKLLVIEDGFMQIHKTDTIQSNLYTSGLTATRDHYLPDASGTIALTSDLSSYVPTTRTISTTSPLSGGGDLSANRTLSIAKATTLVDGYLSATDWTTFNGKQPTLVSGTNIKTINGTTILGSGDLTISTGITIGTTAITSGTVGRVLFEGTGNVVQESANLYWDNTNGRLGIGTSSPAYKFDVVGDARVNSTGGQAMIISSSLSSSFTSIAEFNATALTANQTGFIAIGRNGVTNNQASLGFFYSGNGSAANRLDFGFYGQTPRMAIFAGGNISINTTTDAGFKLDVNGTARVQGGTNGSLQFTGNYAQVLVGTNGFYISNNTGSVDFMRFISDGRIGIGTNSPNASSIMEIASTTRGFLPPRMTTTQKNAIASPAEGLQVWDTTLKLMSVYNGTTWITL